MPKKIMTTANARPESSAADNVMVYLPHHAGARRRRRELTLKQTTAQTEKLRPVYLGIRGGKTVNVIRRETDEYVRQAG